MIHVSSQVHVVPIKVLKAEDNSFFMFVLFHEKNLVDCTNKHYLFILIIKLSCGLRFALQKRRGRKTMLIT